MEPAAGMDDLKAKILHWYGGYNWGGQTMVLNPYSILNFFRNNSFDRYWIQSGCPAHFTALIMDWPLDYIELKLESYRSTELRKSELTGLQAAQVLFQSGI
jgi:hypothetical protein